MQNVNMESDVSPLLKLSTQPLRVSRSPFAMQLDADESPSLFVSDDAPFTKPAPETISVTGDAIRRNPAAPALPRPQADAFEADLRRLVLNPTPRGAEPVARAAESDLLRDLSQLRELVVATEAEVRALHEDVARLEATERAERQARLERLHSELPADCGIVAPQASCSDAELEKYRAAVMEAMLSEVKALEESTAAEKLENNAMEESLHVLYGGIVAEERYQKEVDKARHAKDAFCDTLRIKLQEAHRRLSDHRQRADFLSVAERKYLEQMETIRKLRDELQVCGLQLPILDHSRPATITDTNTIPTNAITATQGRTNIGDIRSDERDVCISTINRYYWEQRCARRVRRTKPHMSPDIAKLSDPIVEQMESDGYMNDAEPTETVRCILSFPHGMLLVLYDASIGPAPPVTHSQSFVERSSPGSSGLRRRAQELGLSLQYLQHAEANPFLGRNIPSGSGPGVRVLVEGQRRLVEAFRQEISAAAQRLRAGGEVRAEVTRAPESERVAEEEEKVLRHVAPSRFLHYVRDGEHKEWDSPAYGSVDVERSRCPVREEEMAHMKTPRVWSESSLREISARVPQDTDGAPASRTQCDENNLDSIRAGLRAIISL